MTLQGDGAWSTKDEMTTAFNNRQYDEMYRSTDFIIDCLRPILSVDETYTIVDAGTGGGANLYYIANEYQKHNFIGVDLNEHYLQQAIDTHQKLGIENTEFMCSDILRIDEIDSDIIGSAQLLNILEFEKGKRFMEECFKTAKRAVFVHSLFTERPLEYEMKVHDPSVDKIISESIHSVVNMKKMAEQHGFIMKINKEFLMDIDLPDKFDGRGTYTVKTDNGKRLQFTDVLYCPWRFLYFEKGMNDG
jgi:cyclopropane fatty-acyl-phospholipid synthase-like methyltransferase